MKVKLINDPIISDYGRNLLRARGIQDPNKFLAPDKNSLQDWRDLDNIEAGANLVLNLKDNATVALVVDSDVDGYTSSAIIYQYLKRLKPNLTIKPYLHEGKAHGLEEHWRILRDEELDLIIAPDSSSNDSEYVEQIGIPVLAIDHHIVETELHPLLTLINNQISSRYKNKSLSGAGMVYQFCRSLDELSGNNWANDYLDLAALGICADMMSGLEIENQYIWRYGFSFIRNEFFMCLARKQAYSITGMINASDDEIIEALNPTSVAFYIVPLINAMIRIGSTQEKEEMFEAFLDGARMVPSTKRGAKGTMDYLGVEVTRKCSNARTHQNKILDGAVLLAESKINQYNLLDNKILFIRLDEEDDIPSELNGLLAMRLSQRYKHPTMVGRLGPDGYIKGSIRGLNNSELLSFKNYLTSTDLFDYVQGHDQAAGFAIPASDLSELHGIANKELANFDFNSDYYEVDFERQALDKDLTQLIEDLQQYKQIWSAFNTEPLIYVKDLHFKASDIQILGKNKDTVKIVKNGIAYMKFFAKSMIDELKSCGADIKMEVVGKGNINEWMGTVTPQIFLEAYEIKTDKLTDF